MNKKEEKTITHQFPAMGGEFQIRCYRQDYLNDSEVEKRLFAAEKEVERIENKLTDFRASPFQEINKFAGIRPVKVDCEIFGLINKSIDISKESDGAFDISYASIGHLWRDAQQKGENLPATKRYQAIHLVDYKKIILNEKEQSVFLPDCKMRIGLGGIGKGHAVDNVYNLLLKSGLKNFYVNGSGDIRVHSAENAPRPWRIGVRNPLAKNALQSIGYIQLRKGSVASSGAYLKKNESSETLHDHHIINPKDGESSQELIASTVLASNTVRADTTATILMNLSKDEALSYLAKSGLTGFVVGRDGVVSRYYA